MSIEDVDFQQQALTHARELKIVALLSLECLCKLFWWFLIALWIEIVLIIVNFSPCLKPLSPTCSATAISYKGNAVLEIRHHFTRRLETFSLHMRWNFQQLSVKYLTPPFAPANSIYISRSILKSSCYTILTLLQGSVTTDSTPPSPPGRYVICERPHCGVSTSSCPTNTLLVKLLHGWLESWWHSCYFLQECDTRIVLSWLIASVRFPTQLSTAWMTVWPPMWLCYHTPPRGGSVIP